MNITTHESNALSEARFLEVAGLFAETPSASNYLHLVSAMLKRQEEFGYYEMFQSATRARFHGTQTRR